MPLYEYSCTSCGRRFEVLMREGVTPACPACRSGAVEKQLSVFAVGAASPKASPMPADSPCAGCQNPAACGFGNN
ncbi:MAG: zinc ribbon domain-containing protein [Acidobacteria bacterium]|nr:zinc ribbon domain-containing protein [Acidobacteriota bacterium]